MAKAKLLPIQEIIWSDKYRFIAPAGVPKLLSDDSVEGTWRRVAHTLAAAEKNQPEVWEERFYAALEGFKFLPAGRIIAGAGTGRKVSLINCMVMGTIHDSIAGIFQAVKESAETLQQGCGIGMDFSPIRPKGAPVVGVGAEASGPLSFMDVWDAMCKTMMAAGARRGAMMGTLRCDHPDVKEFIDAKRDPLRFRNFNLSVLVTDAFMEAVKAGFEWPLKFDGKVYKTVSARELWDKIMRSAYDSAEPGVIFIDRINKTNNLRYCETIASTNPCLAESTLIVTKTGAYPIEDLVGKTVTIWDGVDWITINNFRVTGLDQPMIRVTMQDGAQIRVTPYHSMILENGERKEAKYLCVGDKLATHDVEYDGSLDEHGAYLKGFLCGDGSLKGTSFRAVLYLYEPKYCCQERLITSAQEIPNKDVRTNACEHLDFVLQFSGRQTRKAMRGLTPLKHELSEWCGENREALPDRVFTWTRKAKCEFLAGLFDADGTCNEGKNGYGYQLSSIRLSFLEGIQTLLKSMGVRSKIAPMHSAREHEIAGEIYNCAASWRLSISQRNSIKLAQQVTFERLNSYANRECIYAVKSKAGHVIAIEEDGIDDKVYCCTVPNSHAISLACGLKLGQCAEQPLQPNGSCLLGSLNLTAFVRNPFDETVYFDIEGIKKTTELAVRMLDNVTDVSNYPLKEQRDEAYDKRRIGLGITGLADALIMCGLHYGSPKACKTAAWWMQQINEIAYRTSAALAVEKGAFPKFTPEYKSIYFDRGNAKLRNSHVTSIAPTGTISLLAGNISSGIEPVYEWEFKRKIRQVQGETEVIVEDYAVQLWRSMTGSKDLPAQFYARAHELSPAQHLAMQAALQQHVDTSISKTINCPEDISFEDFEMIYFDAYTADLKVCSVFRPNQITGSVLSSIKPEIDMDATNAAAAAGCDTVIYSSIINAAVTEKARPKTADEQDKEDRELEAGFRRQIEDGFEPGIVGKSTHGPEPMISLEEAFPEMYRDEITGSMLSSIAEEARQTKAHYDELIARAKAQDAPPISVVDSDGKECLVFPHNDGSGVGDKIPMPHDDSEKDFIPSAVARDRAPELKMLSDAQKRELVSLIHESSEVKSKLNGDFLAPNHGVPPREPVLSGRTYKIKWPPSQHAIYITINDWGEYRNGRLVPYEIFINSKNQEHAAWTMALTRMISAIWRRGGDVSFVVEELKAIADPRGGNWINGEYVPSLQARIGGIIEQHLARAVEATEPMTSREFRAIVNKSKQAMEESVRMAETGHMAYDGPSPEEIFRMKHLCPRCGSGNVFFPKANCLTCRDCDYSNCS